MERELYKALNAVTSKEEQEYQTKRAAIVGVYLAERNLIRQLEWAEDESRDVEAVRIEWSHKKKEAATTMTALGYTRDQILTIEAQASHQKEHMAEIDVELFFKLVEVT